MNGLKSLLASLGEHPGGETLKQLFVEADTDRSGAIDLEEFLAAADKFLGATPALCVLIVGGPGTGKGVLVRATLRAPTDAYPLHPHDRRLWTA